MTPVVLLALSALQMAGGLTCPTLMEAAGHLDGLVYVSPMAGSEWQSPESRVILRFDGPVPPDLRVEAAGSSTGRAALESYRPSDGSTVVLIPERPFAEAETVTVSAGSRTCGTATWEFATRPFEPVIPEEVRTRFLEADGLFPDAVSPSSEPAPAAPAPDSRAVAVPSDFPGLVFTPLGTQAPGNFFFAPLYPTGSNPSSYMIVTDETGQILFYRHAHNWILNVEVQPDGCLSFSKGGSSIGVSWIELDQTYTQADEFAVVGYPTDIHDFTVTSDDEILLVGEDWRQIDMSQIVPGGQPDAMVMGLLVQVQDRNHVPVFQWSSLDHIDITEACSFVDLTADYVDYVHCNSLDEDGDGGLLASCLALCECLKIDRQTGGIVWRLGGVLSENSDFTLVGDPLSGFSNQHHFSHTTGNRYTVFDNGTFHSPQISRGLEYQLDLGAMTAVIYWSYSVTGLYGSHFGSTQRLPDGSHVVDWGDVIGSTPRADITEIGTDGNPTVRVRFTPFNLESYRAFKFDWVGQAVVPYLVAEIITGETAVTLTYNVFSDIQYQSYDIYTGTSPGSLSFLQNTPQKQIKVWSLPLGWNYFAVVARDSQGVPTGFSNTDSALVTWTGLDDMEESLPHAPELGVSPCPASTQAVFDILSPTAGAVDLDLFDLAGRLVGGVQHLNCAAGPNECLVGLESLPSGIYTAVARGSGWAASTRFAVVR